VLVVSRFPSVDSPSFLTEAQRALEVLAERPGFRSGRLARAADDPRAWVLVTEWEHIGAWRRALSAYEVKLESTPLLAQAADEPSAYEVLVAVDAGGTVVTGSDRTD
jgi:heme oxygenase (mycobilin-producing)